MRRLFHGACWAAALLTATLPAVAQGSDNSATVAALLPALERYVIGLQQREEIPGIAIVIADRNRVLYAKGFGVREVGKPAPVTADTVFQIGSVTKSFLATTVAMAVDKGKLAWDTPLVDRYPSFRLQDDWVTRHTTVADVMSHGIGLQSYIFDDMIFLGYDLPDRVKALAHAPLTGGFRQSAQYVNQLHAVVGDIAARSMGQDRWSVLLTQGIFKPLNMSASSVTREGLLAAANHAAPHQHTHGVLQATGVVGRYWYDEGVGPAGSINSTANDMGQWLRLQLGRGEVDGKRLVSVAAMDETWRPRIMLKPNEGSALGWGVVYTPRGRMVMHEGGTASYGAVQMVLPEAGQGGIAMAVLTNHSQEEAPVAIARWFADRIWGLPVVDYRADFKRPVATDAEPAAQATSQGLRLPLDAFAGAYDSPTLGPIVVRRDMALGGDLVMQLETIGARLRLVPLGGAAFSAEVLPEGRFSELVAEGFTPIYRVAFEMGTDGKAGSAKAVSPLASSHDLVRTARP